MQLKFQNHIYSTYLDIAKASCRKYEINKLIKECTGKIHKITWKGCKDKKKKNSPDSPPIDTFERMA